MNNELFQTERLTNGSVNVDENVTFDNLILPSENISYDNITGEFTLLAPGNYKFDWWIASQASLSTNGIVFSLVSSQGESIVGNSPIKTDEIVGFASIEVSTVPITISLRNSSSSTVYYSTITPVKASLSITIIPSESSGLGYNPVIAATGNNQLIQPSQGIIFLNEVAQYGNIITMTEIPNTHSLFTVSEDGSYEISWHFQIQRLYTELADFFYDLYLDSPQTLLGRLSQSVTGEYATFSYTTVVELQAGQGIYIEFDGPLNINGTEHTITEATIVITQLESN